ncbi:hypothetical protein KDK_05950 [Dictyobacter kobayashii]|uniref:Uncharacterized protein n=1 Tax=Dictyobacter kobayashii TaxID=2014872 RepID=A0A402ACH6_9CHLR|nr:hypothetical protein KDK_05950 [Dictyobacter kobayashii]
MRKQWRTQILVYILRQKKSQQVGIYAWGVPTRLIHRSALRIEMCDPVVLRMHISIARVPRYYQACMPEQVPKIID